MNSIDEILLHCCGLFHLFDTSTTLGSTAVGA